MQWGDVLPLLQKIGISPDTLLRKLVSIEEGSQFDVTIRRPLGADDKTSYADSAVVSESHNRVPAVLDVQLPALHVGKSTERELISMVGFLVQAILCRGCSFSTLLCFQD